MAAQIRLGILGAGGIGRACTRIAGMKSEIFPVAICDTNGFAYSENGIDVDKLFTIPMSGSVSELQNGKQTHNGVDEMILLAKSGKVDVFYVALPNLPNEFIPNVLKKFNDARVSTCFTDAMKRTEAVELILGMDDDFRKAKSVYITGCGATPGLLTAAAVVAAQSFMKVEEVKIWWGVGISNWDSYRGTIREDIAHLPGFTMEKAKAMSDKEVDALLDKTDGKLTLHEMGHADDVLLEKVGVVDSRDKVTVGGVMDTRSAKKPVTTTMTLTGITFEGKRATHTFSLGDETSMAANVIGPALGYLKRALWLKQRGIFGSFGSTELMPMVVK